jgi:hypothetical protein
MIWGTKALSIRPRCIGTAKAAPNPIPSIYLTAEKVPPIEIHRRMQAVGGDQCVGVSTVRRRGRRFKDGELGHLFLFIFFLSGGKTYQPALVHSKTLTVSLTESSLLDFVHRLNFLMEHDDSIACCASVFRQGKHLIG